jgi:hypothetical protein
MRIAKNEIVDLGEYQIIINYDGKGGLDVTVLDELGDEIEGIYISDSIDSDDTSEDNNQFNINQN